MFPQSTLAAQVATLLPFLQLVSSSPILVEPRNSLASFTVEQKPNPIWKGQDGPAAYLKAFYKYNVAPPHAAAAKFAELKGNGSGTVTATPFPADYDREYLTPVSLGTPPQVLDLDFDTGSSDLWVFSTSVPKAQVAGQKLYNPASSNTSAELKGESWSIQYGDGSACSGTVVSESVSIGGITAPKQGLEIAVQVSNSFTQDPASSGLLGLGFSSINTVTPTQQKVWFENVQSSLAAPVFSVDLKKAAVGTYTFGKIETEKYTGSIGYTTINKRRGFWEFNADGYQVGASKYVTSTIDSIADTGTTLLLLPAAVVKAYYKDVKGAKYDSSYGAILYPCSATLPDFTFGLGSYRGVIPGSYIRYGEVDDAKTVCYGGIQDNGNLPFSIWGDILLKAQYVVFDAGQTRIGFANKKV